MRAALSIVAGPVDSLEIRDIEAPMAGPGEVVIQVEATALNFMDTLIINDRYQVKPPRPFSPGGECAGHIVGVGAAVTDFRVGDRVCAYVGYGAARERVVVGQAGLIRVPDQVSLDQAAALIVTYGTVLYALRDRAGLRAGETLVVTGTSGGVGSAAIELGHLLGARIIACTRGEPSDLREQGVGMFVDPDSGNVKLAVRALTGENGADVVLDVTGGKLTEELVRATGWGGRYLVVGFAAGEIPRLPLNLVMLKSIDVMGIHWSAWAQREQDAHRRNTEWLLKQVADGLLSPQIGARFPLDRISDALALIVERKVRGKIVITM
ncbi:NADPH:quinone oxidoreductase family protein [Bosea sp. (in: a-proteobacteria)]|uniref:NADPH:quinone oxidoreductase family protein n=1 Tax=Bosea sp. (in: a-proteobacteria) TaxID=1871050 RepID=UPI002609991A|nr:NADPH:quinone oxidoreductase family protein [Bosea sp. (in: a-proteobacteria)]MCO5092183.1 NADPH:quinone oxidoreductase family protein [Bosea sp. (in: a-proteobacteria)]